MLTTKVISEVTGKDIPEEQRIFTETWNYLKKYYRLKQDTDQRIWKDFLTEFSRIGAMGDEDEGMKILSLGLARTVMAYIEHRSRQ